MQPADLKGGAGARRDGGWLCYDPERCTKEDYSKIRMPSSAMTAAVDGNLIESIDGGE